MSRKGEGQGWGPTQRRTASVWQVVTTKRQTDIHHDRQTDRYLVPDEAEEEGNADGGQGADDVTPCASLVCAV